MPFELKHTERHISNKYDPRPIYITLRFRADLDATVDNECIQHALIRTLGDQEDDRRPFEVEQMLDALECMLETAASQRRREERDWRCPECETEWAEQSSSRRQFEDRPDGCWRIIEEQPAICKPCTQKAREQLKAEEAELETVLYSSAVELDSPQHDEIEARLVEIHDLLGIHTEQTYVTAEPASELRVFKSRKPRLRMTEVKVDGGRASMAAVTVEDAPEREPFDT